MAQKRTASFSSEDDNGIFTYGNQMELTFGAKKRLRIKSKPPVWSSASGSSSSDIESSDEEDRHSGVERWKRTQVNIEDCEAESDRDDNKRKKSGDSIDTLRPPSPPSPPEYISTSRTAPSDTLRNIRDIESNLRKAQSESSPMTSPTLLQQKQRKDLESVVLLDDFASPQGRQIAVKIRCHGVVEKYKIVKNEPFSTVIKSIADKENVEPSRISLSLKNRTIKQSDTPGDIGITIADIIECLIIRGNIDVEEDIAEDNTKIKIRIQSTNSHSRKEYTIAKVGPLQVALEAYCADQKLDITKIQVSFDGDPVDLSQSPNDLDLENCDILDVRFV